MRKIAREAVKKGAILPVSAPAEPPAAAAVESETAAPPADQGDGPLLPSAEFKVIVSGRSVEKYLGKEKFLENSFAQDGKPGLA